jgi:hypothetical protein
VSSFCGLRRNSFEGLTPLAAADSEITLFHLKCFSEADYQTWAVALENFEPEGTMGAVDDVGIPIVNHVFQPTSPTQDSMASDAVSSLNGFAALRVSPLTPLFPSDSEQPYDIVKREIMRLSDVAGRAPPDLVPTLRSIQASLQRAAESLLLHNNSAPMHVNIGSLGRLRGRRAASILSAATGLSGEERWFDADEGESDEDSNYGSEEDAEAETASGTGSGSGSASAVEQQPLEPVPETLDIAEAPQPVVQSPIPVRPLRPRRTVLPVPGPCESPVSIMSILRQNMGKDLSTVSMPIGLNEPLSALQRLAEEFEYAPLLAKAVQLASPLERLALVSAFAVSGYASTLMRAGRKPFNPLLGETFELVMPERGARFLAEKVCHHPPILAYKGESMSEQGGWEVWGDQQVKSKFWVGLLHEMTVRLDLTFRFSIPGQNNGVSCRWFAGTRGPQASWWRQRALHFQSIDVVYEESDWRRNPLPRAHWRASSSEPHDRASLQPDVQRTGLLWFRQERSHRPC